MEWRHTKTGVSAGFGDSEPIDIPRSCSRCGCDISYEDEDKELCDDCLRENMMEAIKAEFDGMLASLAKAEPLAGWVHHAKISDGHKVWNFWAEL
jgi:reverse gyrase